MIENMNGYIFIGIGVSVSVLGFFLKRIKAEVDSAKQVLQEMQVKQAMSEERIKTLLKLTEDRRKDIQKIFDLINR
mgnify:CR=1 FL=1